MNFFVKICTALAVVAALDSNATAEQDCTALAFRKLGVPLETPVQLTILNKMIKQEMKLGDFEPFMDLWELHQPSDTFEIFLREIHTAILKRHPTIQRFLCSALEKSLFEEAEKLQQLSIEMLHRMYVLEFVVRQMLQKPEFMVKLAEHFKTVRQNLGVPSGFLKAVGPLFRVTKDLFETTKLLTLDETITQYIDFRRRGNLGGSELRDKNKGLFLNVMEATIADRIGGNRDNAWAAPRTLDKKMLNICRG